MKLFSFAALLCAGLIAGTASAQTQTDCPAELRGEARCYTGADQNGSHYWIAIPHQWNQVLVMHAHGGPRLKAIGKDTSLEDLQRFAVTVRQGYAWAGASYRRPGYGVRMAAEDTENLRRIFVAAFGRPRHTLLHGQSWGGNVAAKGIELYAREENGKPRYDGVILTNGMIAGGSLNYLHRADLRAVYQHFCNNHPRPDEPQYPLWMGLPADAKMSDQDLQQRVNECTGVRLPAAQRSESQRRNLANILGVIAVPERTLISHLSWATFLFRDMVQRSLEGHNPFTNRNVVYRGSSDDERLNREVTRFDADPVGASLLANDSDMSGKISVPVLSMHAIDDPTAMVEYEAEYRRVVEAAGKGNLLFQVFTREHEHSKLADPEYAAIFDTMMRWIGTGKRPGMPEVLANCARQESRFEGGCHFDPAFTPAPLFSRVAPR